MRSESAPQHKVSGGCRDDDSQLLRTGEGLGGGARAPWRIYKGVYLQTTIDLKGID